MTLKTHEEDGLHVFEAEIDGQTIKWDDGLTYTSHLKIDKLLTAQTPVSDKPDEMLFIIMHQTMELWMKLLLHEAGQLMIELRGDRVSRACKTLSRMETVIRHMTHSWEVLATLTPHDFLTFRGQLGRASGFQSHQFRELEFRLGLKREDMMLVHKDNPVAMEVLQEALDAPSIYDELLQLVARHGLDVPDHVLIRDFSKPREPDETVEDIWLDIYADPDAHRDLFRLAERFTALEYYFQEWRFKHMKTIARVIGHKKGTGGSAGVEYLVKSLGLTFFPELWSMLTRMKPPEDHNFRASYGSTRGG